MKWIEKYYVKKMIKKIDKKIKVKFGSILECDTENDVVYVTDVADEIDCVTFKKFVKELNPKIEYNTLLLGILHEIGHIFTKDEVDEEQYLKDVSLLEMLYRTGQLTDRDVNYFYVRLPLEKRATEWALEFATRNRSFCQYYQKKIGKEKIRIRG